MPIFNPSASGGYKLIASAVAVGTVDKLEIASLDLIGSNKLIADIYIANADGTANVIDFTINGDLTNGNYYIQRLTSLSTTVTGSIGNHCNLIDSVAGNDYVMGSMEFQQIAGKKAKANGFFACNSSSSLKTHQIAWQYQANTNNMTSLRLGRNGLNALAAGSYIKIYSAI